MRAEPGQTFAPMVQEFIPSMPTWPLPKAAGSRILVGVAP